MMKKIFLSVGISLLIIIQGILPVIAADNSADYRELGSDTALAVSEVSNEISYNDYIDSNGGVTFDNYSKIVLIENGVVLNTQKPSYTISFICKTNGWYSINWDYRSLGEESNNHQLGIYVDNQMLYSDLSLIEIPRMWLAGEISVLENGTQVRGDATLDTDWASFTVYDDTGMFAEPYLIYLTAGVHAIDFKLIDGNLELKNITLSGYEKTVEYNQYIKQYGKLYTGEPLERIEGENFLRTNTLSIVAGSDLSNPLTTPYSYYDQLLNVVGGSNWQYTGQRVEWNVTVPESGLYNIAIRYKQSYKTNMKTYRKLLVNNIVPFSEAEAIPFNYDSDWQVFQPEWSIWLEK